MTTLNTFWRWLACLPVGLIGGSVAGSITMMLGSLLLGRWAVTGTAVMFLGGMIQPIAGYATGQLIAPCKNSVSRWLLLVPYGLTAGGMFLGVVGMIFGSNVEPIEGAWTPFLTGLSPWWQTMTYMVGTLYGTACIFQESSAPKVNKAAGIRLESPFDWNEWAKRWA